MACRVTGVQTAVIKINKWYARIRSRFYAQCSPGLWSIFKAGKLTSLAIKNFLSRCISVKDVVMFAIHYNHVAVAWMDADHLALINLRQVEVVNYSSIYLCIARARTIVYLFYVAKILLLGPFLFWPTKINFDFILAKFWLKPFWPYLDLNFDQKNSL